MVCDLSRSKFDPESTGEESNITSIQRKLSGPSVAWTANRTVGTHIC